MGATLNIGAVLINTPDPEKLAAFYAEAFDLDEPVATDASHVGIGGVSPYLGFDKVEEHVPASARTTLWFNVPDCRKAFDRLMDCGAKSVREPDSNCSPGEVLAVVHDPEGNAIGLIAQAE